MLVQREYEEGEGREKREGGGERGREGEGKGRGMEGEGKEKEEGKRRIEIKKSGYIHLYVMLCFFFEWLKKEDQKGTKEGQRFEENNEHELEDMAEDTEEINRGDTNIHTGEPKDEKDYL